MKDTLKPLMTSNAQDWRTPPELYAKLCSEFNFTVVCLVWISIIGISVM